MSGEQNKIRRLYQFYGSVQGVGFRYRTQNAANTWGVTGWVKNEYDGSVIMEVQGSREQIEQMLLMIESSPFIHIDNLVCKNLPVISELGFRIR